MTIALQNPLDRSSSAEELSCRLCGATASLIFRQTILQRWNASYFQCPNCDLIQTQRPDWIAQAYASPIAAMDTGVIQRNRLTSELTAAVACTLGINADSPCLDYGGGNGVFVRMMRDRGFDFRLYDRYATNIFARGFESEPANPFALVTAFEVFEHLVDVQSELENLFAARPPALLVSTQLHRGHEASWWYYSPETGQHVAFYSQRTMSHIAGRFGYTCASSRAYTLFLHRDVPISTWRLNLGRRLVRKSKGNATHWWVRTLLKFGPHFTPRMQSDNQLVKLMRP